MEDANEFITQQTDDIGDPDTLQTSFTVAEGFGDAVADFGATDTSSVVMEIEQQHPTTIL